MAKYRIQVPITQETRDAYQSLADAHNGSLAAACEEILEQCAPVALQMANALRTARTAPARAMREAVEILEAQLGNADQMLMDLSPKATVKKRKTG
jgi:hypothetical protein